MGYVYSVHIYLIHKDKEGNHSQIDISFPKKKSANKEFKRIIKALRKDKVVKLSNYKYAIATSQILMVTQTERQ